MTYYFYTDSPIGTLCIVEENDALTRISFRALPAGCGTEKKTPLISEAFKQLEEYFGKKRRVFDLPLNPAGTAFQKKVWQALQAIPYGQTSTYGRIAALTGNPKACRAVGGANNKNPIAIVIPCHRVIGANNALTGYAGGLKIKEFLLNLEKTSF